MNSYSLNNGIGFLNTNSVMSEHFNNSNNNNEEVLTTVTNFSTLSGSLKQQISYETGNKKENEKKKWMKRI